MKEGNIKAGIRSLPATLISILKFASLSLKPYKMIKPKHVEFRVVKEYLLYHYLTMHLFKFKTCTKEMHQLLYKRKKTIFSEFQHDNVHYINMLRDHLQCNPASIPFIPYVHFYLKKHASCWPVWNFHFYLKATF